MNHPIERPNLAIREAASGEGPAIGEMLVQAYRTQYARKLTDTGLSPERLAELRGQDAIRARATVLVAERDGRLAGTVALYAWGAPGSEAWIHGAANLRYLAVDPAFHGRGFSHALLEECERLARRWGAPAICLHTRRGATGLVQLYELRGYVREPAGDLDFLPKIFLEAFSLRL